jgi:hypothetical protein
VIGRGRLVGSPKKRFFHDPQRDSARAAVAATRGLQFTRQASLVQVSIHLGLVFVFCCRGVRRVKSSVPQLVLARMEWSNEDIFKFIEQHDLFHKPSNPGLRALLHKRSKLGSYVAFLLPAFSTKMDVVRNGCVAYLSLAKEQTIIRV